MTRYRERLFVKGAIISIICLSLLFLANWIWPEWFGGSFWK